MFYSAEKFPGIGSKITVYKFAHDPNRRKRNFCCFRQLRRNFASETKENLSGNDL